MNSDSFEDSTSNVENYTEVEIRIDSVNAGMRIDVYLCKRLKRISRKRIQNMILRGQININGERVKRSSQRLTGNSVISFLKPLPIEDDNLPAVEVLYHIPPILALSKPGDLTIHPTAGVVKRTLTHWLAVNGFENYTPSHRLDRETSGLIICAEKGSSSGTVKKAFEQRLTSKAYVCIVRGNSEDSFVVDRPVVPDLNSPIRIKMATAEDGPESLTEFITISKNSSYSLVAAFPRTGRQHQIRAHLEYAGFPIAGDKIYGCSSDIFLTFVEEGMTPELLKELIFHRQMLHSIALSIPVSGDRLFFYAPPPDDFIDAVSIANLELPSTSKLIEIIQNYL